MSSVPTRYSKAGPATILPPQFNGDPSQAVVTLATGQPQIQVTVPFVTPPTPPPSMTRRPIISLVYSILAAGGTLDAGTNYYYHLVAFDADGNAAPGSLPFEVIVPPGPDTRAVVLTSVSGISPFDDNAVQFQIFRATGGPKFPVPISSPASIPSPFVFTDTGTTLGTVAIPPSGNFLKTRVYWRATGDTQWHLGIESQDRTQTALTFIVPLNITGQTIDIQLRGVSIDGTETSQAVAQQVTGFGITSASVTNAPNFQSPHALTGTVDGVNVTFTFASTPNPNFLITVGGLILIPTTDYTVSGTTVTFTNPPLATPIAYD